MSQDFSYLSFLWRTIENCATIRFLAWFSLMTDIVVIRELAKEREQWSQL